MPLEGSKEWAKEVDAEESGIILWSGDLVGPTNPARSFLHM